MFWNVRYAADVCFYHAWSASRAAPILSVYEVKPSIVHVFHELHVVLEMRRVYNVLHYVFDIRVNLEQTVVDAVGFFECLRTVIFEPFCERVASRPWLAV